MGRGPVVEKKSALTQAARSKTYALHSKLISMAAQTGGNPDDNPRLFLAISRAKKDSVPADVIARAVKKGTGEDKSGSAVEEVIYEGYAAGGVALVVRALTDNRNRTAGNIRHIFAANGGNLGETGSVTSFAFSLKGITLGKIGPDAVKFEESAIESGCDEYFMEDDGSFSAVSKRENLAAVAEHFRKAGFEVTSAAMHYVPNAKTEVQDFDSALKTVKLLQDLDQDEDVEFTWSNEQISDALRAQAAEAIEKAKFRT